MQPIARRQFLRGAAVGTAIVSVPQFLVAAPYRLSRRVEAATAALPAPPAGYFEPFGVTGAVLQKVIGRGLARGGDFCEVYLQHQVGHWTGLEDGRVDRAAAEVALGAGIRVLKGFATGYAYCEDLTEAALLEAATTAAAVADGPRSLKPAAWRVTPIGNRYPVAVPWSEVGVDQKIPLLEQVDRVARAYDPRIVKVSLQLEDEHSHILVADSEGRRVADSRPMTALRVNCVAVSGGQTETSGASIAARAGLDYYSPAVLADVAKRAADYTVRLFDAVAPPWGQYPIVLAPGLSGILLHEAIGHGMEADFNRKGVSIYAGRIGSQIAPRDVTIVDDATNDGLRGSLNVDDEGEPGARTVLVENGMLRSYMHDHLSAKHYGVARTGSGRRESFRFPPVPRMRNTYMLGGPHAPEEALAGVSRGLYAEMFLNGEVNIGAGDFTFYLKHGRLIENGRLTHVVKDANLIGNGPKVLASVEVVCNDPAMYSGAGWCGKDGQRVPVSFGLPTLRVGSVSVGGRTA